MFQSVISLIPMFVRILFTVAFVLIFDLYAYQAIKTLTVDLSTAVRRSIRIGFWVLSIGFYVMGLLAMGGYLVHANRTIYVLVTGIFFAMFVAKILMMIPMLMEDIYRIGSKIISLFQAKKESGVSESFLVSRKRFISQISAGIGGLTFTGLTYGVIKGAHDYKVHRANVSIAKLPGSFKGLKIGHLSDIHSGSFWDMEAVKRGVAKMMAEKPDIIFFTGDLVNSLSDEMNDDYIAIFGSLKAPMGVYSILGNHDYGDYHQWPDKTTFGVGNNMQSDKSHMSPMQIANLEKLMSIHASMGWELLLNENRVLQKGEDKIALIGVENYGARGRFARYGKLDVAYAGIEDLPVKILLSHDPSHWDSQVRKLYKDIDLTLSGHTHGAQFGIEAAGFKWSPIKYMYKQWAGIYKEEGQYLYVNRGFGYLGYPGRLGILP
jgi:predicted MPP superfamily phosphohydrolase